jgi:hypothetical protein
MKNGEKQRGTTRIQAVPHICTTKIQQFSPKSKFALTPFNNVSRQTAALSASHRLISSVLIRGYLLHTADQIYTD